MSMDQLGQDQLTSILSIQNQMMSAIDASSFSLQRLRLVPSAFAVAGNVEIFLASISAFESTHPEIKALAKAGQAFLSAYDMISELGYVFPPSELLRDRVQEIEAMEDGNVVMRFAEEDVSLDFATDLTVMVYRGDILSCDDEPSLYTPEAVFYYLHDEIHRSNGLAAVLSLDGQYREFWENGQFISSDGVEPEEFSVFDEEQDDELDDELDQELTEEQDEEAAEEDEGNIATEAGGAKGF